MKHGAKNRSNTRKIFNNSNVHTHAPHPHPHTRIILLATIKQNSLNNKTLKSTHSIDHNI